MLCFRSKFFFDAYFFQLQVSFTSKFLFGRPFSQLHFQLQLQVEIFLRAPLSSASRLASPQNVFAGRVDRFFKVPSSFLGSFLSWLVFQAQCDHRHIVVPSFSKAITVHIVSIRYFWLELNIVPHYALRFAEVWYISMCIVLGYDRLPHFKL